MTEKQSPAGSVRPTKKQRDILTFIENFIKEHGYSPSYREIMNGLNYTSVATVSLHVNSLIRRGHLAKRDRSARSLEVVKSGATPLAVAAKPIEVPNQEDKSSEEIWLSGKIEELIRNLEAQAPTTDSLIKLETVYAATQLLGLPNVSTDLKFRLEALQARLTTTI